MVGKLLDQNNIFYSIYWTKYDRYSVQYILYYYGMLIRYLALQYFGGRIIILFLILVHIILFIQFYCIKQSSLAIFIDIPIFE